MARTKDQLGARPWQGRSNPPILGTGLISDIVKCEMVMCHAAFTLLSYVKMSKYEALHHQLLLISRHRTENVLTDKA